MIRQTRIPRSWSEKLNMGIILMLFNTILLNGEAQSAEKVTFDKYIHPLLESKCFSCHGEENQEGDLRLDSLEHAKKGGEHGPAIKPGDVEKSLLIKAVTHADPDKAMPPKQRLSNMEIQLLTDWVKSGAKWPEPVVVLFDEDQHLLESLKNGNGTAKLITENVWSGTKALSMTPLQKESATIAHWDFKIREKPSAGEYRYLRLAWKKKGEGSVMIELALNGNWPDPKSPKGRYVAGKNSTGWAAIQQSEFSPENWTVVTLDLFKDIGEFTLTGFSPTCDRGEAAFFDSIILGRNVESLDAYHHESSWHKIPGKAGGNQYANVGDAFTDERNPVRRIFSGERLDLWSLKKPVNSGKSIDQMVKEKLAQQKTTLAPSATPEILIRRLSFDLTGLPPTYEEVETFSHEYWENPDKAYIQLVDRLLQSNSYGVRQARLWLDVVRYADTNGYERDEFRPLIYKYRDYVVKAFNEDKPYDRFIKEQLAGDELINGPPRTQAEADCLVASGYLRLGQWDSTAPIFQEEDRLRSEVMTDVTNTTASAFLGLTFACCQCHDHKYDPLTHADHYRFRAFFAGIQDKNDTIISLPDEIKEIDMHNKLIDDQLAKLKKEKGDILGKSRGILEKERKDNLTQDEKKLLETDPAKRDDSTRKKVDTIQTKLKVNDSDARNKLNVEDKKREQQLTDEMKILTAKKREPQKMMTAPDSGSVVPETYVFFQGDYLSPRERVLPGFPSVFTPGPAAVKSPSDKTTGRRLALAEWIASKENPWTARVMVNRIWQQHFGRGLVDTPNDFGYSGARPLHQELLDTLAVQFMVQGWSIKKLHREIVMSAAYRQTAKHYQATGENITPARNSESIRENITKSNVNPFQPEIRRLDAETLRDSLLFVSGQLIHRDSGPPLWPPVNEDLLKAQPGVFEALKGDDSGRMQGWYENKLEETHARSLYLIRKRSVPIPFLQVFDLPDSTVSCAKRDTTVVAPQALMMINSPDSVLYAKSLAKLLLSKIKNQDLSNKENVEEFVHAAFKQTITRKPNDIELRLSTEFVQQHRSLHARKHEPAKADHLAVIDLCRAVLILNEFTFID